MTTKLNENTAPVTGAYCAKLFPTYFSTSYERVVEEVNDFIALIIEREAESKHIKTTWMVPPPEGGLMCIVEWWK
jgi:hypothetical protein